MDQEHLTPEEQSQLKQGEISGTQQEEDRKSELGENFQGEQNGYQQQQSLQEDMPEKDIQKELESDVPPDPKKDFMGYIQWLGKALHKQEALLSKQAPAQSSEVQQLQNFYQQSVVSVKQKHHDFDEAADFIYDTRAKQLAAYASLYPEMADPKVVDTIIGNELKQILRDCAKKKQNPAEVIYSIAQKIGYTNISNNTSKYEGENLQKMQNSARTLAAHNGLTTKGSLSLDMLDKMSEREFSNWVSEPKNKAAFNRLMGGREA
ncbi:hypothetical protein V4B17_05725 [Bartonella sp. B23]